MGNNELLTKLLDEIRKLPYEYKPVNHWEGVKYKPYTKKMVDLDKVIEKINKI